MRKRLQIHLDFEVDKLTSSIENVVSGEVFATDVLPVTKTDLKLITKKNGWVFDWKYEAKQPEREFYKLTIVNNIDLIQGLISMEVLSDHIFMHLIESASFNKGKAKNYFGVPTNLVAFVCRLSLIRGFEGNVSFLSKTRLIAHYTETLGAFHVGGHRMVIDAKGAKKLINKYFKD